jgi:predicted NUDIX family NTP pyrophosphohydrolase
MFISAGTLLYRKGAQGIEVILVHPSGIYNTKSPWGIPKGISEIGEDYEAAARRETLEECGVVAPEKLIPLGESIYPNKKKKVFCFAGEVSCEPTCASWEIDQAKFFPIEEAKKIIHAGQAAFLDRLQEKLNG